MFLTLLSALFVAFTAAGIWHPRQPTLQDASTLIVLKSPDSVPIPSAKVTLYQRNAKREWEQCWSDHTDQQGQLSRELEPGKPMAITLEHPDHAPFLELIGSDLARPSKMEFVLYQPESLVTRLVTEGGLPLANAMVVRLTVHDPQGRKCVYPIEGLPIHAKPYRSDANGILRIDGLPRGARVELHIFHPTTVLKSYENLVPQGDVGQTLLLEQGIPLRLRMTPDHPLKTLPADLQLRVSLFAEDWDYLRHPPLFYPFPIPNGTIDLATAALRYQWLKLYDVRDEYVVTPQIESDGALADRLHWKPSDGSNELEFLVRKRVLVQGRVTGDIADIASHLAIYASIENLTANREAVEGEAHWIADHDATFEADGRYRLQLPPGLTRIKASTHRDWQMQPESLELTIHSDGSTIIPDIHLSRRSPDAQTPLRGRVLDDAGNPIPHALVRVLCGYRGTQYERVGADGSFSIPLDPQWEESGVEPMLIALECRKGFVGWSSIDTASPTKEYAIHCSQKNRSAFLPMLIENQQTQRARFSDEFIESRRSLARDSIQATLEGDVGSIPPDLANGSWYHTPFSSLQDFRGKVVLLDFWFMECGPCRGEIPNLLQLQEAFDGTDFAIIGVSVQPEERQAVENFARSFGITYPLVIDNVRSEIGTAYKRLGAINSPFHLVLDRDGKVAHNDYFSQPLSTHNLKWEIIFHTLFGP